jgi:hypothetical protein
MYNANATEYAGLHNPPGEAEFAVFRASDCPDLGLERGWYWNLPECRAHSKITPRAPDGSYQYAEGPYNTPRNTTVRPSSLSASARTSTTMLDWKPSSSGSSPSSTRHPHEVIDQVPRWRRPDAPDHT